MMRLKAAAAVFSLALTTLTVAPGVLPVMFTAEAASGVAAVVNGTPITTGDVQHRVNFLKLQRTGGNLSKLAKEQLINEALERQAVLDTHTSVSDAEVDAAFARFAAGNKLTTEKLTGILNQAGVGVDHFKSFIAISMSWPRAVQARFGAANQMNSGDIGARIAAAGANRPKVNEYILKQIIFVVPEKRRNAILGKRKAEAEASRKKFPGCEQAKAFAATMHDVAVKDLGRFLEPELPELWKPLISKAQAGGTTGTQATPNGVEYIAICSKREVSDDAAAAAVFREEDLKKPGKDNVDPNAKKYLDELRAKAQISSK